MRCVPTLSALLLAACATQPSVPSLDDACPGFSAVPAFCVSGSRTAMFERDDLSATVRVSGRAGLTGVGPIEGLQGEITVYDGTLYLSSLDTDGAEVRLEREEAPAVFFAGGTAKGWTEVRSDAPLRGLDAVEAFVRSRADKVGIELDQPFAFRIEGKATRLGYHVIFKTDSEERPHTMALHRKAKAPFRADGDQVRIAGVWADAAGIGRYTHPGRHTHLHVVTSDEGSGHVDEIELMPGATLFLPTE
ncbi:MAG: acetolactate decarboxylase [Pseudomonadota bacterium]